MLFLKEMDKVKLRLTKIEHGQVAGIVGTQICLTLGIDAAEKCAKN